MGKPPKHLKDTEDLGAYIQDVLGDKLLKQIARKLDASLEKRKKGEENRDELVAIEVIGRIRKEKKRDKEKVDVDVGKIIGEVLDALDAKKERRKKKQDRKKALREKKKMSEKERRKGCQRAIDELRKENHCWSSNGGYIWLPGIPYTAYGYYPYSW